MEGILKEITALEQALADFRRDVRLDDYLLWAYESLLKDMRLTAREMADRVHCLLPDTK